MVGIGIVQAADVTIRGVSEPAKTSSTLMESLRILTIRSFPSIKLVKDYQKATHLLVLLNPEMADQKPI